MDIDNEELFLVDLSLIFHIIKDINIIIKVLFMNNNQIKVSSKIYPSEYLFYIPYEFRKRVELQNREDAIIKATPFGICAVCCIVTLHIDGSFGGIRK